MPGLETIYPYVREFAAHLGERILESVSLLKGVLSRHARRNPASRGCMGTSFRGAKLDSKFSGFAPRTHS
jgi:hypothetical protein